ncbi:MAG: hypothetical protein NC489_28140 [Ruminococcus flavefaciens]|nr:hypothetical protein [Ruminococcus flavefaciens]
MKKILIPTAILCTALCIGLHTRLDTAEKVITTPEPPKVEVTTMPSVQTSIKVIAIEQEATDHKRKETITEVITPEPTFTPEPIPTQMPTPAPTSAPITTSGPNTSQPTQSGNEFYFPGFGYIESQGEGAVTHDETIYENGNKVGSMD